MTHRRCGIVILHGKWGKPPFAHAPLGAALAEAGHQVASPTLPWALRRLYDRDFTTALDEIEGEMAHLRQQGCDRVVLAGHSLGACAALAYAAQRGNLDGLALLAPAHFPARLAVEGFTTASLATAREALVGATPERRIPVVDVNQGQRHRLRVAPAYYLSYFDPAGPTDWAANARRLPATLPVLWAVGRDDPAFGRQMDYAFHLTPAHGRRVHVELEADHGGTPEAAAPWLIRWLADL
ncbi:MAG: alpha/beta fold hydrolase [Zoogloeaceae bacterium]|nr:alpha/beta fold hydrolase [Zoogloeaceae bacterium]